MEDTILLIIFFVVGILLFIGMPILNNYNATEKEKEHFTYGVLFFLGFIMAFAAGATLFSPKKVYLDKFGGNIENITEYQVDTTFTTTNGLTDTTYTLFYNSKK